MVGPLWLPDYTACKMIKGSVENVGCAGSSKASLPAYAITKKIPTVGLLII